MNEIQSLIEKSLTVSAQLISNNRILEAEIVLEQTGKVFQEQNLQLTLLFLKTLGFVKQRLGRNEEALSYLNQALEIDRDNSEIHNNLGLVYSSVNNVKSAIYHIEKAIKHDKNQHYLYSNLGIQYRKLSEYDKAIALYKKSNRLKKDEKTYCMLADCFAEKKEYDKALRYFKKAVELNPDFVPAHCDMSYILLAQKKWKKGWKEYEWRFRNHDNIKKWESIFDPNKLWKGESLIGKTIIISNEQGLGDFIHFFRYVKLLKGKVIVHCPKELENIFSSQVVCTTAPEEILSGKRSLPEYDYYCSVCSLPHLLNYYSIDSEPYLSVKEKIELPYDGIKVGIVWAGSPQHPNDRYRSCKATDFKKICQTKGFKFFDLQKDKRKRKYHDSEEVIDLSEGHEELKLIDLSLSIDTFEDTAKCLKSLDLLISVDTSIVHLSGAMGVPTWVLLSANSDWRWGHDKLTPWYCNLKTFKQTELGNWKSVFDILETEISKFSI